MCIYTKQQETREREKKGEKTGIKKIETHQTNSSAWVRERDAETETDRQTDRQSARACARLLVDCKSAVRCE